MKEKERKILYSISENAGDSHNVLAKKLRISREVFDYHLKKFEDQKIITGYQARINISNFTYGGYILLIQSLNLNKIKEENIIKKIKKSSNTQYIGKMGGEYDFIIGFTVKDLEDLSEYMDFINNTFSTNKSKSTLLTMIKEFKDSFKSVFSEKNEPNQIVSMPLIKNKIEVDDIDKNILIELGKNCNTPSWKIGERTNITEVAIRKRIKKLQEKDIILGYRTMIDLTKLDYQINNLFIKTNTKNIQSEKKFQQMLINNKHITYIMKITGEYNYIITVATKNHHELNDFIINLRNNYSDVILGVYTSPLFEIFYHAQIAENFLK